MKLRRCFFFFFLLLLIACEQETEMVSSLNVIAHKEIGWDKKQPCTIEFNDNSEINRLTGAIKYRGGISSKYHKHSFALELDDNYSFSDLPEDDDWIINAGYIDKTFMRHKISYDLFREMNGQNVAAKSAYTSLYTDSIYQGLYLIMEEINGGMVGLDKADTMAMIFKDPPIFYEEKPRTVQDSNNFYQQKFPKIFRRDKSYYLEELHDFMFNSSDADFARRVDEWFDVQNVIDWHIMLLFSNNDDGLLKNFYLYKLNSETPFRFAIWDYDHSFGRDGDNELNMMERPVNIDRAILLTRLLSIAQTAYIPRLKRRWNELREDDIISVKNFEKHMQAIDKVIADELDRNFEKWPVDNDWYYDDNTYEQELNVMREYIRLRIPQLDEYFETLSY